MSVKEAAERLREWTESDGMRYPQGHMATGDAFTLADAYMRELDPTPIDTDWVDSLSSIGEEHELSVVFVDNEWWALVDGDAGEDTYHIETRGELRTLCRVLRIELKEEA